MPRVTVIIPTYNYAAVLPYSIGSVLRQTFTDFELLVIGDRCTDSSESVVSGIKDPRVRWINLEQPTGHQSGPNNEGIRQARGDLIAYLGHDDVWLPNHLALMVRTIDAGADVTYGITLDVQTAGPQQFLPLELDYVSGMWIPPTSVVHRREPALKLGGWRSVLDIERDPEADLWQRLHEAGAAVRLTRMLTAIKFAATTRKGVYATRPTHEQEAWTARITSEPDVAAVELAQLLRPVTEWVPYTEAARTFAADTLDRVRRRLVRIGRHGFRKPARTIADIHAERLKFKGVESQR